MRLERDGAEAGVLCPPEVPRLEAGGGAGVLVGGGGRGLLLLLAAPRVPAPAPAPVAAGPDLVAQLSPRGVAHPAPAPHGRQLALPRLEHLAGDLHPAVVVVVVRHPHLLAFLEPSGR